MAMSPELKAKLKAANRAKRAVTVLLKDISPDQLAIFAVDSYEDLPDSERDESDKVGYLSRASKAQIESLQRFLPHKLVHVASRIGARPVVVFPYDRLRHALEAVGVTSPEKYLRRLKKPMKLS